MANASNARAFRTLALDTSHFGQFVLALNSRRADERRQAAEFEAQLDAGAWVLALSYHHLAEIYTHADPAVREQRLSYIRSRPIVAYVRSRLGGDTGTGTIVDVLATEVAAALETGSVDTVAIADAARPDVFGYASGRDVMRAFDEVEPLLAEHMRWQREQARRTVAISQADVERAPNLPLGELLRLSLRSPADREVFLRRYGATMMSEVVERGDADIKDPAAVATAFMASVREDVRQVQGTDDHPLLHMLKSIRLRSEELHEEAKLDDLQFIAFCRHRASIAARGAGLDSEEVALRVRAERLPSAIISEGMTRFGQQPKRRKGSVMNDTHLVCLSPYATLTSVDKGTLANVERASARCPVFRSVIGAVARGRTYVDLIPRLPRMRTG